MRIVCQQTILMKYHALFVIFEKAAKFKIAAKFEIRIYSWSILTLKAPIMTAAGDKFCNIFPNFQKK